MIKARELNQILNDEHESKKLKILNEIESQIKFNIKAKKLVVKFKIDKDIYEEIKEELIKNEYKALIREDWGYDEHESRWWINYYELIIEW